METILITLASFLFSYLLYRLSKNQKAYLNKKISDIESYEDYIKKIRKYSIELYRHAFMWLFLVLAFISAGLFIPEFLKYIALLSGLPKLVLLTTPLSMLCFMFSVIVSILEYRTYSDVLNFEKAMKRSQQKKETLKAKLSNV